MYYKVDYYRGLGGYLSQEFVDVDTDLVEHRGLQEVLDTLIDKLAEEGDSSIVSDQEELEECYDPEQYSIGGNEGKAFVHYGYLNIELATAEDIWDVLTDVTIDEEECIDIDFLHFPVGTHREEIWHWIEETYKVSIGDDLMYKEC